MRATPGVGAKRVAAIACLASTLTAAMAGAEVARYRRPFDVAQVGIVRVRLPSEIYRRIPPDGTAVLVLGPRGEEVPFQIVSEEVEPVRVAAEVLKVERHEAGWSVVLDLGSDPSAHRGVRFDFEERTLAPGVALEASQDAERWRLLTREDLFRLGEVEGTARVALAYPSSTARYLRLSWPLEAGYPELRRVEVELAPPRENLFTATPECRNPAPGLAVCRLSLDNRSDWPRQLEVEIRSQGEVGFRLSRPAEARWIELRRGIWHRSAGGEVHLLTLPGSSQPSPFLRLELYGGETPSLTRYQAHYASQLLELRSDRPGRHTLVYGPGVGGAQRRQIAPARREVPAQWLELGPEESAPEAAMPVDALSRGAQMSSTGFQRAWPVTAPEAAPGNLIRLAVPQEVYAAAARDLQDVRLEADGHQVPYLLWSPPEPSLALEARDVEPETPSGSRISRVERPLPDPALPLTVLHLSAPPQPFRRLLRLSVRPSPRPVPGGDAESWGTAWLPFACDAAPPLPCVQVVQLPGDCQGTLRAEIDDGDNPPLPGLDLEIWRRQHVLLFFWPAASSVRLLAGKRGLQSPRYDIAALGRELLQLPWVPATLGPATELGLGRGFQQQRWILPATLALAAVALLWILGRTLRAGEPPPAGPDEGS